MFSALIEKLQRREDLSVDEASAAMSEIMDGKAAPAQMAGFLIALVMKGERPAEIVGLAFGGNVVRAPVPMHGKVSSVEHDGTGIFKGVATPLAAGRYHSLVIADPPPDDLEVCGRAEDGTIMAVRHRTLPVHGVQFHPESVLTGSGHQLLRNFLDL